MRRGMYPGSGIATVRNAIMARAMVTRGAISMDTMMDTDTVVNTGASTMGAVIEWMAQTLRRLHFEAQ